MSEAAISYVEITGDKLQTLTKTAGVTEIEPIFADIYAKALQGQNLIDLLTAFPSGGAAAPAAAAASGAAAEGAAAAEEEKEEAKEESDEDMGMGLFD
ncbi:hypothetical protein TRICI_002606 [Trichomonascus ciferrii]|uniref:60S acidic ribosomal protein P1 n=1 Tax=Trichomonascus ciferrii TaxID=44093 RepID=A0A642V6B3_9ASCO|nr:hypothetical protein TRICI_002606 [Trichomonascus ciferrii]